MTAHPLDVPLPPELPALGSDPARPRGAEPESEIIGPIAGRYDLGDRIAKGGMGLVYRAQDRLLNRTVAIKIIRSRFLERPDLLRRFLAEARINGRLQHPGVVPVYEVGTLPDTRPFIAMKLIEGRTLAKVLRERNDQTENLAQFVKVFEALCQTVAYAHQQGVIHRDLKPDNVMVGEFGEVQVMDWGLAKFLDPSAALAPAPDGFEAVERSVYLSGDGTTPAGENQTQVTAVYAVGPDVVDLGYTTAGEVFGTLPYMPPEQARGEADRVDRRGDVFSLGAILCQILTGEPPYFGPAETLREQAREGKLFGAFVLLDRCGADPALITLAKNCLVADPDGRPADAGVLAALVTQCLDGLQHQTRAIEVKRLTAEARLAEAEAKERLARRARRLSRTLAVVGVLVAGLLASGLGWYANDRAARAADAARRRTAALQQINHAVAEARVFDDQARTGAGNSLARDAAAKQGVSAYQRAEALFETCPNPPPGLADQLAALKTRVVETERGMQLTLALEDWRANLFDARGNVVPGKLTQLKELLEEHGFEIVDGDPETVATKVESHPAAAKLRVALIDWLVLPEHQFNLKTPFVIARVSRDDSPHEWRRALTEFDAPRMASMLMKALPHSELPASWLILASRRLVGENLPKPAEHLLAHGVRRFPADFTLNAMYGFLLRQKPDAQADAVRYLTVARTARPKDPTVQQELGLALAGAGRTDEALETLRSAVKANPNWVAGHIAIGELMEKRGEVDAARASYLAAIALDSKSAPAHLALGRTEFARGDWEAAESAFRAAVTDGPDKGLVHAWLGRVHLKKWEASRAVAEYRAAVEAELANSDYRLGLIEALRISNDTAGAVREARTATRDIPTSAALHRTLGDLSRTAGDKLSAVAAYKSAAKCDPTDLDVHRRLAETYQSLNDPSHAADAYQAIATLRPRDTTVLATVADLRHMAKDHAAAREAYARAVEIDPTNVTLRLRFARFLADRGDAAAVEELAAAVKCSPESADVRAELGDALFTFGRLRAAAAALRSAAELVPADGPRREALKSRARTATRLAGLSDRLADVLDGTLTPGTPAAWAEFGEAARRTKRYAAAARCFTAAAERDQRHAGPAAVCAALAGFGHGEDVADLSPEARAEWRQTALVWFRESRVSVTDPLLEPLSAPSVVSALPAEERSAWRTLWAGE